MNTIPDLSHLPIGLLIAAAIGGLIGLTILIFFLLNLMNALQQCAPQNQRMAPGLVWLLVIPFFSIVWLFFVVIRMSESLAAEYRSRNMTPQEERPGFQIGMAYAILGVAANIQYLGIPYIGQLCSVAGLVCFIIYWVKIAKYKNELKQYTPFQFGNPNQFQYANQQQQYNNPPFPGNPYQQQPPVNPSQQQYPPHYTPPPPAGGEPPKNPFG